jgi:PAS domain S-box-containing protein
MTASAQDAIIMTTSKGIVSYWNAAANNIFGYDEKEAFGNNIERLIIPKKIDSKLNIRKLFYGDSDRSNIPKRMELVIVRSDGSEVPLELSLSSVLLKSELNIIGIFRDISERKQADDERKKNTQKMLKAMQETIKAMSMTVEARDPYTAGHQRRVAVLAEMIAERMGLSEKQIKGIYFAGLIHDMGKIHIPAEILSKPSKLTEIEYALLKTHPQVGYDIMKSIDFPWPIAQIIYQHHERIDGSGYPLGLSKDDILIESQIISIADVVESMASHRPYRPSLGSDVALEEINKNKKVKYNEEIVKICTDLINKEKIDLTKL